MENLIKFLEYHKVEFKVKNGYVIAKDDYLNLSKRNITELPDDIHLLKADILDLSNNQITTLPISIGYLKVGVLYLSYNKIKSLPESIGVLKVNTLYLHNNKIKEFPEVIGNLKVDTIYLSNNPFKKFPKVKRFEKVEIGEDYIFCDWILTWFNKKYEKDGYTVFEGDFHTVVTRDFKNFAHGKDFLMTVLDLEFKLSGRDKNKYIGFDKGKKIPVKDMIIMYRVITGACRNGLFGFIEEKRISYDSEVSVNDVLKIARGRFGYKDFKEFFK